MDRTHDELNVEYVLSFLTLCMLAFNCFPPKSKMHGLKDRTVFSNRVNKLLHIFQVVKILINCTVSLSVFPKVQTDLKYCRDKT